MNKTLKRKVDAPFFSGVGVWVWLMLFFLHTQATAQTNQIVVKGVVKDAAGALSGVSVTLKEKQTVATQTDANGRYSITVPANGRLLFTLVGYEVKEIPIAGDGEINVILEMGSSQIDEVAVVAFGTQKKSTMVGAVTTINPKELKGPTSNLTTMLAGRVAGMIAYQRSGEPGRDNADFYIRGVSTYGTGKKDPLILINGIESSPYEFARVQPDDIASFSILKDASAAALFGARGANGVVLVTTKQGHDGKTKFNVRYESSLSSNTRNFKFADNITYMELANEAKLTRMGQGVPLYSAEKIERTRLGMDPFLYPSNDWMGLMVKDNTLNSRLNFSVGGGGTKADYYVSGTANIDNGIFNTLDLNGFNTNVKARTFGLLSDFTLKFTPSTRAKFRLNGNFSDYNGPVQGGGEVFKAILKSNPVMFPAIFDASYDPLKKHPLFGNAKTPSNSLYFNPYAAMLSGYEMNSSAYVLAQVELHQDFNFLLPGLTARIMGYTKRRSYFAKARQNSPFYYSAIIDPNEGFRGLQLLNEGEGREYLSYAEWGKDINNYNWLEAAINYNKVVEEKHDFGAMLVGYMSDYVTGNAGSLIGSLPKRNISLSGRFTYGFDSRYLMEFNFGYNGSERFHEKNRFGFFPSIGVAWNLSEESFLKGLKDSGGRLKLRGSYGLVGNDQIGNDLDRFYYMSDVNMNNGDRGYTFGQNFSEGRNGISVNRYASYDITWEKAYKTNLGLELGLFNSFNLELDLFKEHRTNILQTRPDIPLTMGLSSTPQANLAEVRSQGLDATLDYTRSFMNNSFLTVKGTFTYATNKITKYEETDYPPGVHRSIIGNSTTQALGFVAERYFIDDLEVANSPKQFWFSNIRAGDLKYHDINGDGKISDLDEVPLGYPTTPEIIYGLSFTYGYKSFDISALAQGSARSSFFIEAGAIAPFLGSSTQNGLLQSIVDSHWSENNQDLYAFYPRLSADGIDNNYYRSSWWMRDGAFVRLKTLELGYNLPSKLLDRYNVANLRVYANGMNLWAWSRFKLWDVEMGGNGLGYPVQRVFNFGVQIGF